ncbi:hypothetical protein Bbelb_286590 [Branchiostoma belcheri]|nr:hypothetical protein Bbelb_286590 [Branchiostoma belcheri]
MERATTTYGKERILAKLRFVNQTQPIEDGPPNIKMEGNDRQQANKDNITRPTHLENTTSSANVVRTVEPQTSICALSTRQKKTSRPRGSFKGKQDQRARVRILSDPVSVQIWSRADNLQNIRRGGPPAGGNTSLYQAWGGGRKE